MRRCGRRRGWKRGRNASIASTSAASSMACEAALVCVGVGEVGYGPVESRIASTSTRGDVQMKLGIRCETQVMAAGEWIKRE